MFLGLVGKWVVCVGVFFLRGSFSRPRGPTSPCGGCDFLDFLNSFGICFFVAFYLKQASKAFKICVISLDVDLLGVRRVVAFYSHPKPLLQVPPSFVSL